MAAEEYNFGPVPMSVCVIKPDAVEGGRMQEVLSALENHGFILLQQDMQMMTTTKARALYLEHEKADFFKSLIGFMTSGPINAVLLTHSSSPDPVAELQRTVGPTNSEKARADAPERCEAMAACCANIVHGLPSHRHIVCTCVPGRGGAVQPAGDVWDWWYAKRCACAG